MGSSTSIVSNVIEPNCKIYKPLNCNCYYSCIVEDYICKEINLPFCCYQHLDSLRNYKYDRSIYIELQQIYNKDVEESLKNYGWLTQSQIIQHAQKRGIKGIYECIDNNDMLKKYHVK
jgi:hypothetical protein